jgi:hypothetical protein
LPALQSKLARDGRWNDSAQNEAFVRDSTIVRSPDVDVLLHYAA